MRVKGHQGWFKVMRFDVFGDRVEVTCFGPETKDAMWRTFLLERLGAKKKEPK